MGEIVKIQRWCYPLIVRVVMKRVCYHAKIIESEEQYPDISFNDVCKLLDVHKEEDWLWAGLDDWESAKRELDRQKQKYPHAAVSAIGFFITVRPRSERERILIQDHPPPVLRKYN